MPMNMSPEVGNIDNNFADNNTEWCCNYMDTGIDYKDSNYYCNNNCSQHSQIRNFELSTDHQSLP